MRHVESIATVLFKSTWRGEIIKDEVSAGPCYGGMLCPPPVVSGIGLAEKGRKRERALAWQHYCLELLPSLSVRTAGLHSKIPERTSACWYLSADISSTKPNSSHKTNWLKTESLSGSPELKRWNISPFFLWKSFFFSFFFFSDAAQYMLLIMQRAVCEFVHNEWRVHCQ